MKNIHLFNRFKMNLISYSKFLWKDSSEKGSESSGETRKPTAEEVDLLVERGTVEDYIKRRTGEVMGGDREKQLQKRVEALESGLKEANDTVKRMQEMFKKNNEKQAGENKKLRKLIEKQAQEIAELEKKPAFGPDELRDLGDRIISLENAKDVDKKELAKIKSVLKDLQNREMVDPTEYKDVKERVDKLGDIDMLNRKIGHIAKLNERVNEIKGKLEVALGKLDKINPEDINSIKESVKDLQDSIDDLANNGADIQRKIAKIMEKLGEVNRNKEAISKLIEAFNKLKDEIAQLKQRNAKPTPPDKPGKTGDEGGIEDTPEKLGTRATLIANRIYLKLKDKMPRNWKFTAAYHHAKCWKYFNIRPGTNVKASEKGNTDEKYCLYDRQNDQYFYTDAWYHFLLRKLMNPEEYDKIMKFKPTKE